MRNITRFAGKNKTGATLIALLLISLIFLVLSTNSIQLSTRSFGLSLFSLSQSGISKMSDFFSQTVNSINELKKLRLQYAEMEERLNEYRQLERNISELQTENEQLREQLGFSEKIGYEHLSAEIIGKDPGNYFNTIMINRGKRDGVEINMPVIAFQDGFQGLIGKVVTVGACCSEVLPLFDRSCYVAARMQSSRYEGLVSGKGGDDSRLIMQYVKKHARSEIKYGDLVITSGMNSIFPRGIYIGRVRNIGGKEYDTSLNIELEPVIDFSRLEYVFVLSRKE